MKWKEHTFTLEFENEELGRTTQIVVLAEYTETRDPGDYWTPPYYGIDDCLFKVSLVYIYAPGHKDEDGLNWVELYKDTEPEWKMAVDYIASEEGQKVCSKEFDRTI